MGAELSPSSTELAKAGYALDLECNILKICYSSLYAAS